jgi:hypothetical protein
MTSTQPAAITHSAQEHHLTAQGLQAAYGVSDEHPLYTRSAWRAVVASGETSTGYWDWVQESVTTAFDDATGQNDPVVLRQKVRQLRRHGYALVMFWPEELEDIKANELENYLVSRGNQFIADSKAR